MFSSDDKRPVSSELLLAKIDEILSTFNEYETGFNKDAWIAKYSPLLQATISELGVDRKELPALYLEAIEKDRTALLLVPESERNIDICLAVTKKDFTKLELFPKHIQEDPRILAVLIEIAHQNADAVLKFPEHFKRNKEIWLAGLENAWQLIGFVPDDLIDQDEFKIYIQKALEETENELKTEGSRPKLLEYIPKKYRTADICLRAAYGDFRELKYFPDELLSNKSVINDERLKHAVETCLANIKEYGQNLEYLPKPLMTYDVCLTAIGNTSKYGLSQVFDCIPKSFRDLKICKAVFEELLNLTPIKNYQDTTQLNKDEFKELCDYIVEKDGRSLSSVPVEFRDKEMCITAVANNEYAFEAVPVPLRSAAFCKTVIEKNPKVIGQIGKYLATTQLNIDEYSKLCVSVLKVHPTYLQLIPEVDGLRDYDMCLAAVESDPAAFEFVPKSLRNFAFLQAIIEKRHEIFRNIGNYQETTSLRSLDEYKALCVAVLKGHGQYLQYIPENLRDLDMCMAAVASYILAFEFVPKPLRNLSCCKTAVKSYLPNFKNIGKYQDTTALSPDDYKALCVELSKAAIDRGTENYLDWIPKDLSNYQDICLAILEHDESAFDHVAKTQRDLAFCEAAIKKRPAILKKFANYHESTELHPDEYKTLCMTVLKEHGKYLEFIPENLRDPEMCMAAIENDPGAFQFVPVSIRNFSFCKTVIEKNPALISQIRNHRATTSLTKSEYKTLVYPEQHNTKYFAMLNNAVAVSDTKLEGGRNSESLAYYHYLLNLELPDCPLGLNITEEQAAALQKGMTDLIAIQDLLEESHDNATLNTEQGLDNIINAITEHSKQSGVCYLPSGWTGKPSGHFAGLKLRRLENGHFAFSLINHGGGMEYHRKVSKSGSKDKYIYQSDEYDVNLQSDQGRELLQKLLELQFDLQRKNDVNEVVNQYSALDLYGLLKLYGKELPLTDKLSEKAVTPQRGGTCTVTNLHAIARDILINSGADLKTRKRYHFVMKLRSIIAAFAAYQQDKNKCPHNVMAWALREFATRINKEYRNVLNDDEMIYCSQLQAVIQAHLDQDKKATIQEKCKAHAFPDLEGAAPKYRENLLETIPEKTIEKITPAKEEFKTLTVAAIKPAEIVTLLKFEKVYEFCMTSPTENPEKNKFYIECEKGKLKYTVINPLNEIVSGVITQDELKHEINASLSGDEIKKLLPDILNITANRDDVRFVKNVADKDKVPTFNFKKMYDLFNSLPHCSGLANDPFWDNVPKEDIGKIIQQLTQIIAELTSSSQSKSRLTRAQTFAMALMAYDIAAQLAARLSTTIDDPFKLGNHYAYGLDDVYSEQNFFNDPIAYHTVKRIAANFGERSQGKARVLTNAVNYDNNKYDKTVHYIIREILTDEQRSALQESLKEKTGAEEFTDEELFGHLMENIQMKYDNDTKFVLDETVAALISLSATAHKLGHFTQTYQAKEKENLWLYNDNQFHHELARLAALKKLDLAKHLPTINESKQPGDYQDWSENALFHPENSLTKLRDEFKKPSPKSGVNYEYAPQVQLHPYQLYPSGSLSPESTKWEPSNYQAFLYEQLNEDFRHIECTPNLQIVRALAWAKNNLDKLRNEDVRERIDELIFQYGKLDSAYANQLEPTLLNMEHFLAALLNYCKDEAPDDTHLLVWGAILAHDLRYHLEVAAKLYKFPLNTTLPSFQELMLKRIRSTQDNNVRSTLASIVVCDFRNTHPLSVDDYCLALVCRMVASLGDSAGMSDEVWHKIKVDLLAIMVKEGSQITEKLNKILPLYLKLPTNMEWRLVDSQLVAEGSDLLIDLATGSLQKQGNPMKERTAKTIAENNDLFTRLHLTEKERKENFSLFYSDLSSSKVLESGDGRFEFSYSPQYSTRSSTTEFRILTTHQLLTIEKTKAKFKLLNSKELENLFKEKETKNPFESASFYNTNYQYWQAEEDKDLLFARDEKNSDIAYCYSLKDGVISQLTANQAGDWVRSGKLLLNLTAGLDAIKAETEAKQKTNRDEKPKEVIASELEKKMGKTFGLHIWCCQCALHRFS